ncbi:MAG: hypothetical protein L0Y58_25975 [Verrucomicrobia subdivision 3 bacterium]|nr:hypothetical protein [Limisphaerales bacterium]
MPRPTEVTRFLRAAVKTGLRLQRAHGEGTETVASLQRIKASMQKTRSRRKSKG